MRIIEPSVEKVTERGLRKIELIGKVCTKQEHTIKDDTAEKFVYNRIVDGHTAILEHEYVYFRVKLLHESIIDQLCSLSPYIRLSYNNEYIGFSYRLFIDLIGKSRRSKHRINNLHQGITVNDLFYTMLLMTPELSFLMYDQKDIENNIHYLQTTLMSIIRVYDEEILNNAPEIYNVTFKITTDRGITHELVRHKEQSYMQESTRYCNYSKNKYENSIAVIQPEFGNFEGDMEWADAMSDAECHYMEMTKNGISAQLARGVLPTATKADLYMSGTLDMWIGENVQIDTPKLKTVENKGFLPLRDSSFAHPQMIPIAKMIKDILMKDYSEQIQQIKAYGNN